ncbi:MAG: hypothetical protein QOJ00_2595 [Actinomycetota bacterium]|jgi:hypothetical protein
MRIRRWTTAGLAALVAVPALFVANAGPAHAATGPYGGSATGDLVHVLAAGIPGALDPALVDAHVAPSKALVNSAGLGSPYAGKRSAARATNADASLIGGAIPLNLVTTAEQTAPPNNSTPNVVSATGPIDLSPIATADLATGSAIAHWGASDTTCVAPGTPIAQGKESLANASVLTGLGDPLGDAVLSITNGNGGAAYTQSTVGLVDVAGQTNKGLKSESLDQLTGVVLFKGTANELTINVVAPPRLTAIATGKKATSDVTYTEPVLQIIQGGTVTNVLDASDANLTVELPGVLLRLKLGTLDNKVTSDTEASGTAKLLELSVLDITGTFTLATAEIAPMTVSAKVPAGGVTCGSNDPLANVQVDASTPIVLPGGSFEYAVTVPNTGDCTVNNVKVVLTVTGPSGTTITSITQPPPGTISGLTATWPDIGNIAPGELKVVKATVKVPSGATSGATFKGTATASGTCDGAPVSHTADSGPVPQVGAASSGCDLSASSISSSHKEVRIGDYFNEYVRLANLGKTACNGIKVTVPYPPDTSFVTCTDGCTHDDTARVVTWNIPSLASGTSKDLVATFKVNPSAKSGENLGTSVTITSGKQIVTDKDSLPIVTAANVLNAGAQRSRGLLPRTGADLPLGLALTLMGAFLGLRGLRRRIA